MIVAVSLHRLDATQLIPIELTEAWGFFSDPGNLALITPPWLGCITSPDLLLVCRGLIITYTIRPLLTCP
jgi:ligand-binding SRPBCC domain-containing protein